MGDGMKVKANSLEELHSMIVEMINLASRYNEKYPEFDIDIEVSHKDLVAGFKVYKNE